MEARIGNKFGRELKSLFSLTVMNIVFSGIAMGISLSFALTNAFAVIQQITGGGILSWSQIYAWPTPQILIAAISIAAAVLAMRWLIYSAEMLSDVDDLMDDYQSKSGHMDDDGVTSLIVRTMAYYRAKKNNIKRLAMISRAGGVIFIAGALVQAANGALVLSSAFTTAGLVMVVAGVAVIMAVGIAGLMIPRYFSIFSKTWDLRLKEGEKAEEQLKAKMGGMK